MFALPASTLRNKKVFPVPGPATTILISRIGGHDGFNMRLSVPFRRRVPIKGRCFWHGPFHGVSPCAIPKSAIGCEKANRISIRYPFLGFEPPFKLRMNSMARSCFCLNQYTNARPSSPYTYLYQMNSHHATRFLKYVPYTWTMQLVF